MSYRIPAEPLTAPAPETTARKKPVAGTG
jgi:hypothetical protein